jgi:hypothetical protein
VSDEGFEAEQLQAFMSAAVNVRNQSLQPVPTAIMHGVLESTQGPCAAVTFMHPAGESSFLTQDPQDIDNVIRQLQDLKQQLALANTRWQLMNPTAGLVVPTPNVPGANGAKLL